MSSKLMRDTGYFENITPPSAFPLKRAGTASTKDSHSTYDSSTAHSYYNFPSSNQGDTESGASTISYDTSSLTSRQPIGTMENRVDTEFRSLASKGSVEEGTLPSLQSAVENDRVEDDRSEHDDPIETKTKSRSLALAWDRGDPIALSFRAATNSNSTVDDECQLPEWISKSDITVTIDIDDEARSSRAAELDEENLDVEILHHVRHDSGEFSPRRQCHRKRRKFEETVRQGILDDLKSVYTATPKTAKLVLCVVVSVLSDGTLDHTFWSGGRVGLTEIVLQWVMFDPDNLQVYKRGRVVQKKDFGFGPLGLTENEGHYYLATSLAPRAANQIISIIGNAECQNLLVEI